MEEQAFLAVNNNELDKLKMLLENGTVPATITQRSWIWTLAQRAVQVGHLEILKYLLKKEPLFQVKNTNKVFGVEQLGLLELAVKNDHFDIVKYLVEECNADIFEERRSYLFSSTYNTINPIHIAVRNRKLKIFKYLIKKGNVDVNAPVRPRKDAPKDIKYPKSLLFIVHWRYHAEDVLKYLLEETNIDVSVVDDNGDNILFHKGISLDVPIVKLILEKHKDKFDINKRNHAGKTFLQHYISTGGTDTKFIQYIAEKKGVSVNVVDKGSNLTLLHHAVVHNSPRTCKCLIELGVNIEAKDKDGDTALHLGAIAGFINVCKVLIEHSANINQKNCKGDSPLHYAINGCLAKYDNLRYCINGGSGVNLQRTFVYLINHGANVTQENNEEKTPIDSLIAKGDLNGLKYLIRRGIIHVNQENKHQETLVHLAAIYDQVNILDYLVRIKKANINTHRDKIVGHRWDTQSPLHTALVLGYYGISKYLMKHRAEIPKDLDYDPNAEELYHRIQYDLETGRARRSIALQSFSTHFQNPNFDHGRPVLEGANHSIQGTENPVFSMMIQFQFHNFLSLAHFLFSYMRGSSYQPPELLFPQRQIEDTTIEETVNSLPDFKDIE